MKNPPKKNQTIRYIPEYTILTGSLQAGLLLSQLVYWAEMMKGKPFYKTNVQLSKELGMTTQQTKTAKKLLLRLNLITTEIKKEKGVPKKTYYEVRLSDVESLVAINPTLGYQQPNLWLPATQRWVTSNQLIVIIKNIKKT